MSNAVTKTLPKSNYAATRPPRPWDDASSGWSEGSEWLFEGTNYKCLDPTDGRAVWAADTGDGSDVPIIAENGTMRRTAAKRAADSLNVRDFSSVAAMAAAVGYVRFPRGNTPIAASMNLAVPVYFDPDAYITVAAWATVTISGAVHSPEQHIFRGAGAVSFGVSGAPCSVSPVWWGASPTALAAANTTAVNAAIAAAPSGGTILFTGGDFPLNIGDLVFGGKKLTFKLDGATIGGTFPLGIPALVEGHFQAGRRTYQAGGATGGDFALKYSYRDASYTGGVYGDVNAGILHVTDVRDGVNAFEWGIVGVVNNSGGGEPTAVYAQGNRMLSGAGPVWALTAEARDKSGAADPTVGLIGAEIDCFANGTDANGRRFALDIVVGKGLPDGAKCEAAYGIHIGPAFGDTTQGRFKVGVGVGGDIDCGVDVSTAAIAPGGVAFRQAMNQRLSLTSVNDRTLGYTSSGLEYAVSGSPVARLRDDGSVHVVGVSSGNVSFRQPFGTFFSFVNDEQRKLGYTSSGLQYYVGASAVLSIGDSGLVVYRSFTVATLPSAAANNGATTRVSDGTSGRALVTSDGTNWRYQDGAIAA